MSLYLEVNPQARSTWVNHPRPGNFPEFERELLELGGRHPNGRQILTLDWAPECRHVRLGQLRHSYVDDRIPCHRVERSLGYRVKRVGVNEEWRYVPCDRLDDYGPEYLLDVVYETEIRVVSYQRWLVRQYVPPEQMRETPAQWERRRYRMFTPPETGVPTYADDIGPYPSEGLYDIVLIVQSPRCSDVFDYAGECRQPDADVLSQVRAVLKAREEHHDGRTLEERVAGAYANAEERDRKARAELDSNLDGALGWHGRAKEGDVFTSLYNPDPVNKGAEQSADAKRDSGGATVVAP
jgi:hypothetical protein